MTSTDFECLNPGEQVVVIFEAKKLAERMDEAVKVELFRFDNFYIEIKTCPFQKVKRTVNTYSLRELPAVYASQVISLPFVVPD